MCDYESVIEEYRASRPSGPFWSCSYIESGMAFNVNTVTACCVTQHGQAWPFLADFDGGTPPIPTILRSKRRMTALNQDKSYPQCANCTRLTRQEWPPQEHLFDRLLFAHFRHCNIACRYCSIASRTADTRPPYRLLPALEHLFRHGLMAHRGQIHWGGGEPTVLREFEDVMAFLADYSHQHIIYTNCVIHSPRIEELLTRRSATLTCSVDSGSREVYLAIKQRDYSDRVWANIRRYAATGGDIVTKMLVLPENYHDVLAFAERSPQGRIRPGLQHDIGSRGCEQCGCFSREGRPGSRTGSAGRHLCHPNAPRNQRTATPGRTDKGRPRGLIQ